MVRGERPIKAGKSWFSAKSIEVERHVDAVGGRALDGLGGREPYQTQPNSEYGGTYSAVRLREISFVVKRETAQIAS